MDWPSVCFSVHTPLDSAGLWGELLCPETLWAGGGAERRLTALHDRGSLWARLTAMTQRPLCAGDSLTLIWQSENAHRTAPDKSNVYVVREGQGDAIVWKRNAETLENSKPLKGRRGVWWYRLKQSQVLWWVLWRQEFSLDFPTRCNNCHYWVSCVRKSVANLTISNLGMSKLLIHFTVFEWNVSRCNFLKSNSKKYLCQV